jgi:hypothetical protein
MSENAQGSAKDESPLLRLLSLLTPKELMK